MRKVAKLTSFDIILSSGTRARRTKPPYESHKHGTCRKDRQLLDLCMDGQPIQGILKTYRWVVVARRRDRNLFTALVSGCRAWTRGKALFTRDAWWVVVCTSTLDEPQVTRTVTCGSIASTASDGAEVLRPSHARVGMHLRGRDG